MGAGRVVYLIGASVYVYRAWHALPDSITDPEGRSRLRAQLDNV